MKKVTLRYFAAFRDATGQSVDSVETDAATVRELFVEQARRHAALEEEASALVALNDQMVSWDSRFEDGDEVLFFPPVAGG